jgi:hypothetical protein
MKLLVRIYYGISYQQDVEFINYFMKPDKCKSILLKIGDQSDDQESRNK